MRTGALVSYSKPRNAHLSSAIEPQAGQWNLDE
jgi:hypothetical protein